MFSTVIAPNPVGIKIVLPKRFAATSNLNIGHARFACLCWCLAVPNPLLGRGELGTQKNPTCGKMAEGLKAWPCFSRNTPFHVQYSVENSQHKIFKMDMRESVVLGSK